MKTYTITTHSPCRYALSFHEQGFETQIALTPRETIFLQLVLQSVAERLESKIPHADMVPAWGNSGLN
ncbi:MAG: hypothetical protein U7M05_11475 [Candidatus Igneacidithiobacillus chanchocoensis]